MNKNLTPPQRAWIAAFEQETGFEFPNKDELDGTEIAFDAVVRRNLRQMDDFHRDVYQSLYKAFLDVPEWHPFSKKIRGVETNELTMDMHCRYPPAIGPKRPTTDATGVFPWVIQEDQDLRPLPAMLLATYSISSPCLTIGGEEYDLRADKEPMDFPSYDDELELIARETKVAAQNERNAS